MASAESIRIKPVPLRVIANFTRQLTAMLAAGVPLLQALETLTPQDEYPQFGLVIENLSAEINSGTHLSRALAYHPRVFSQVYVTLARVGEETGTLESSLDLLADWLEKEDSVRRKLLSAFTYPAGIFLVSLLLSVLLFTTVLPTFAKIFKEMQVSLPLLTRIVMGLTHLLCQPWAWAVTLLVSLALYHAWGKTWESPGGSRRLFGALQRVPVFGQLLYHGSLTRYAAAGQALLHSGIDVIKASRLAGQASGSPLLAQDGRRVIKSIEEGETLSTALQARPALYSATLIQMLQAGEEASLMPEMLTRVAHFHELELNSSIDTLSATLEPIMLLCVALMVGSIVLSIYLPMYSTLLNMAS